MRPPDLKELPGIEIGDGRLRPLELSPAECDVVAANLWLEFLASVAADDERERLLSSPLLRPNRGNTELSVTRGDCVC